ncbi:MAG: zinc ribbon domain-containing protein [Candidatus Bathyarchaeota archaeon]|nr:MAG: zinc ribbon domain-containing protein [Candidatus Bathyarchaeota archaeon]
MVSCPECGEENEEDAGFCVKCGAPLSPDRRRIRRHDMRDECFGLPGGNSIIGILIGLAIIFAGARELFHWDFDIGPYAIILVGLLFVGGAIYRMNQSNQ